MQSFFRLAKLKAYFKGQNNEELNTENQTFKPPRNKKLTPDKNHHNVETYIEAKERELKQQGDISDNKGYNSSKSERIAIKELSDLTDIIITKADKGAVVITDIKDYINEGHRELNNKDHYKNIE